jgi:hypothetical protein
MKKLFYLILFVSSVGFGQITLTSNNTGVAAAGTNSLGISLTIASGDTLGVLVVCVDSGASPTNVTDSQGSNWILTQSVIGVGSHRVLIYYTLDTATTGSRTVTVNVASSTNLAIGGSVFAGTVTSSVVDHSATNSGSGIPTVNFTVNGSDSLVICAFGTAENDTYGTWDTGQVEFCDIAQGGSPSNRVSVGASREIVTSSGTNNQTLSGAGINGWGGVVTEFKAAVPPPSSNNKRVITIN